MAMEVMHIRRVRMGMSQRLVRVPVRMGLAGRIVRAVLVPVVLVVNVRMRVAHRRVRVEMLMMLG